MFFFVTFFSDLKAVKLKPTTVTKADKESKTNAIDMVDSGIGAVRCMQQPEQETVILMKNNEQRPSKLNKCNDKQTNNGENNVFDEHRHNCDNLRLKNASNDDTNGAANGGVKMNNGATMDAYSDGFDEDPYAELESYLEKVKVSFPLDI